MMHLFDKGPRLVEEYVFSRLFGDKHVSDVNTSQS